MKFNVDSTKLFEGLAEVVAKQVEGNALPLLKPIDEAQDQLEVSGSAVAKTDVDARHVLEELMDAKVRMERDAVYQQNEWLKHDLASERKRTLVYKEKYEVSEEIIVELEERNERQKEEIRIKDEEITKLKAILEYLKENPQQLTIVLSQYNNQTDNRSQVTVQEMVVKDNGVGVQTSKKKEEDNGVNTTEDIKICRFIVQERIMNNTTYGRTEEERMDSYNRLIYRQSNKKFSLFVKFLKGENEKGNLKFDTQDLEEIYNHLLECYETLHGNLRSFKDACHGSINGKKTDFYWSPI